MCQNPCGSGRQNASPIGLHSQHELPQIAFVLTERDDTFETKRYRSASGAVVEMGIVRYGKPPSATTAAELADRSNDFLNARRTNRFVCFGNSFDYLVADRTDRRTEQIQKTR